MGITGHLPAIPPQQTGRKLDGSAISRRVSACRADAAGAGSKSSLKGPPRHSASGVVVAGVCPQRIRTMTKPLVCARQRPPQFPLRPYSPVYAYHVGKEVGLARDLTATFQKGGVFWTVCCAAALVLSFFLRETGRAAHPQPTPA